MRILNFLFCSLLCFQHGHSDIPFLRGRWVAGSKDDVSSYFQVRNSSIYAIKKNAKLSMDIKNIQHRPDRTVEFEMANLRIHSVPMVFNVLDYKIVAVLRLLMKHGVTLEFQRLSSSSIVVNWTIREKDRTLHTGRLTLSNVSDET